MKFSHGGGFVEDKLGKIGFSRREELYEGTAPRRKSRSTNYGVGFDAPAVIQVCSRCNVFVFYIFVITRKLATDFLSVRFCQFRPTNYNFFLAKWDNYS